MTTHVISGKILQLMIKIFPDPSKFRDFSAKLAKYWVLLESEKITLELFKERITDSARKHGAEDAAINILISDIESTSNTN